MISMTYPPQQNQEQEKEGTIEDTLWYLLLTIMQKYAIKITRKHFKRTIRKICDARRITRASIGIIAGARAEMWFDGGWQSVSFDVIEELAAQGTDLIFIEKAGVIDPITKYGDRYGVAFVNSRGYLTEYAHDLIRAAKQSGANIIVITDYDLSGINLASKCDESVYFITMDDNTLQYFGLVKDERLVVDATNKDLIPTVEKIVNTDIRFADVDIEFLRHSRIEINGVLAQVGAERFWNFIADKLKEQYPTRNYNRAIQTPSKDEDADEIDLYPKAMKSFIKHYREKVSEIVEDVEADIVKEQDKIEGFLDVAEQKKKNKERVMKVIAEDDDIAEIEAEVTELCEKLDIEVKEEEKEDDEDAKEGPSDSGPKTG